MMPTSNTATAHIVEIPLPELGESVTEATITRWLVGVGEAVEKDQPMVEISTDKVDAEINSPVAGIVHQILAREEEIVTVGTIVASIETTEAQADVGPPTASMSTSEAPIQRQPGPAPAVATPHVFATPVARKLAARHGIDLARLRGSGSRGRITRSDVTAFIEGSGDTPPVGSPAHPSAPGPTFGAGAEVVIEPMSRIRRLTAKHLLSSQSTSVHVTTVFHADMGRVVAARERSKRAFADQYGTKLTFMPFIFDAVIQALDKHRNFNASIEGTDIVYKRDINIGMAVATERGLIVPVIQHADRLDLAGLATAANDLAERARVKKLKPDEITRGTFTITNPGVYGSLFGTPIIHQPQVAILCIGTIEKRPVVVTTSKGEDAVSIRPMSYLALTYDHRLIDGADAEMFMRDVLATLDQDDWDERLALR